MPHLLLLLQPPHRINSILPTLLVHLGGSVIVDASRVPGSYELLSLGVIGGDKVRPEGVFFEGHILQLTAFVAQDLLILSVDPTEFYGLVQGPSIPQPVFTLMQCSDCLWLSGPSRDC
jgi:hypothetical protein